MGSLQILYIPRSVGGHLQVMEALSGRCTVSVPRLSLCAGLLPL